MRSKMNGFTKFVLSVSGVMILISMVMCIILVTPKKVHAERLLFLEDGTLTVWVDAMKVDGIPKEITDADIAFKLVSGQLKETRIDGKVITYQPSSGVQYVSPWSVVTNK